MSLCIHELISIHVQSCVQTLKMERSYLHLVAIAESLAIFRDAHHVIPHLGRTKPPLRGLWVGQVEPLHRGALARCLGMAGWNSQKFVLRRVRMNLS